MSIKFVKQNNIRVYTVNALRTDAQMTALNGTFVLPSQISLIIQEDADVYIEPGHKLLMRFRKSPLTTAAVDQFYDNVHQFARGVTTNRGTVSRVHDAKKSVKTNDKVMTNIFGFIDGFSPRQKFMIRQKGYAGQLLEVRAGRFNVDYPEKYNATLPLLKEIDVMYKKLLPTQYNNQHRKSSQTPFRIAQTSFTTVTTNINFRTAMHKDRGDDADGFGNLTVMSRGQYSGAETCFPQFGVGVDVQNGDMLFMDVHQWHGNLPMKKIDANAVRMSVVCYLRTRLWEKTKGKSKAFMESHLRLLKSMRSDSSNHITQKKAKSTRTRKKAKSTRTRKKAKSTRTRRRN